MRKTLVAVALMVARVSAYDASAETNVDMEQLTAATSKINEVWRSLWGRAGVPFGWPLQAWCG